MDLAALMMVKDEADIIYENLLWHSKQGITHFFILNNGSTDETYKEIYRFRKDYPNILVQVELDLEPGYYQSAKMTLLAKKVYREHKIKYMFPIDADEFWTYTKGTLAQAIKNITEVNDEPGYVHFPMYNRLPKPFYNLEPYYSNRFTHRALAPMGYGKVFINYKESFIINQGNHDIVCTDGSQPKPIYEQKELELYINHFPYRSLKQIESKIINGGKAYLAAKDLPEYYGEHWRKDYEDYIKLDDNTKREYLEKRMLDLSKIKSVYDPIRSYQTAQH